MEDLTPEAVTRTRRLARLAAGYASRGWAVLPTRGKVPIISKWETEATRDPVVARACWHQRGEWAGRNVAIATGPSGLVVVDLDLGKGHDGAESWRQLARELGFRMPQTYTVRTPSGGLHYYFRAPKGPDIRPSAGQVAPGIDIRAWGGLVVAAGSVIGEASYELIDDSPPAEMPDPLARHLWSLGTRSTTSTRRADSVPEVIPQGERETQLVSMAGSMRRRGMSSEAILAAIQVENDLRCSPPVEQADLERIAGSIGRYEPAEAVERAADPETLVEVDPELLEKQLTAMETSRVATEIMKSRASRRQRDILGGMTEPVDVLSFIKAGPDPTEVCIWGNPIKGGVMGWAENQGVIIAGPPGTGKSTIALQVILRRVGILEGDVLGMPVKVDKAPLIYLAMDRADQIRQSIARMVPEDADPEAVQRLRMIDNLPPTVDLRQVDTFITWLKDQEAHGVVLDSAKDLGFDLNDSAEGQAFNFLVQATLRAGIQIFVTHHSRKTPRGDKKPLTLNDMHGSQWVAAGAGSVIMLDGEAGPGPKRLRHVKPLTVPMPPLLLELDPESGEVRHSDDREDEEDSGRGRGGGGNLQDRVLELLSTEGGSMTAAAISRDLGSNSGSVSKALRALADADLVYRTTSGWSMTENEQEEAG